MYAVTVFLGAFLLFQLQPIMGKYLLPWFGGGPGVWATCLFFFQAALLAGYAYAYTLTRCFSLGKQALFHIVFMVAALASLPIVPPDTWKPAGGESPWTRLLWLLTCNVGVPYVLLASTGPLVQQWYSSRASVASTYRLYSLSNLASLLALLTYPVLFETWLKRSQQAALWSYGFVAYCVVCAICAVSTSVNRASPPKPTPEVSAEPPSNKASFLRRILWVMWPACASALLLSTTNKLCLDVASVPLLWIAPLSVYLLSFVICFDNPRWYSPLPYLLAVAVAVPCLCWALFAGATWPVTKQVLIYCGTLMVCCLVCHGEVFRIRPGRELLTQFYLLIATGGAFGGLLVSLVAPAVLNSYCEINWCLAVFAVLVAMAWSSSLWPRESAVARSRPAPIAASNAIGSPDWRGLGVACLWIWALGLASILWLQARRANPDILYRSRNFYGVLTVFEHRKDEPRGHHYLLQHGRITHGLQLADPQLQSLPTTYYSHHSGLGLALSVMPRSHRRLGVIGLGTGTIAAYARAGDSIEFYEINPAVRKLATAPFTYLEKCAGTWTITPGDARLSLENQPNRKFDLLALDAFSSDAIPVHLLTREAFALYLSHLETNGVLAVHISNHFLDLEPVLLRQAREFGLKAAVIDHDAEPAEWWIYSSTWVILSKDERFLSAPIIVSNARTNTSKREVPLWTDDHGSIFQVLR